MGALRDLLLHLDVDTSTAQKKLESVDKVVSKLGHTLGALAEAFVGSALVHGMTEFIAGQIEAGSRVNDLSERLGVGTDELQQFQFAAGLAGVGSEEAAKALQFLNKNIGEAIGGNKEAVETFAKLGVTIKDTEGKVRETGDIVPEVADAFEKCESDAERTALAMKVFGKAGASLIPLLKGGSKGLKELSAEFERLGGGMSEEFIKKADEAGDEVDKVKFAFNGWKSQIAMAILPLVIRMAKQFQGWVGHLRHITKETRLASVMWVAFGAASSVATFKAAAGFAKMLGVLPKDASVWKTLLGLGWIGLVIAGVALLVLAFEDLYSFLNGDQSVIGDVIESLFGVGASKAVIDEVKKTFAEFMTEVAAFKPVVDELGKSLQDIWPYVLMGMKAVAKFGLGTLALVFRTILYLIKSTMTVLGSLLGGLGTFAAKVGSALENDKLQSIGTAFAKTGIDLTNATTNAAAGLPRNSIDGGQRLTHAEISQTNNTTVNVTGIKDVEGAGKAAARGVREGTSLDLDDTMGAIGTGN